MTKFLRVTYRTGDAASPLTTAISGPYTRLVRIAAYARRVMAGSEPFAVWKTEANTHPVTGAPCAMRARTLLNGREVVSVEEVVWVGAGEPDLADPFGSWVSALLPAAGPRGTLRVRNTLAERLGVPHGTALPVKGKIIADVDHSIVELNADGSRLYSLTVDGIYEDGVRIDAPTPDAEDAAAMADVDDDELDDDGEL